MSEVIIPTGSNAPTQDAYTGLPRQITVDTDNNDLRLHDGVTPGGHSIINRDNGDARWQQRSVELNGFSFNPELRGFLTRQSAGNYRIRSFAFDGRQFAVTNPDGYDGNPTIALNLRIGTSHIFEQDIIIEGVLQVDGGINADTSGTHQGGVVGDVTGNVTGNLTGNAAGAHTGSFTGAVDVRGESLLLDDEQIAPAKITGLVDFIKLHAVPIGIIMLWSGDEASIPAGWALCDGLNGTPDLTDKFIVGAGSLTYEPGDSGGASTHAHATTMDEAGTHTHVLTIAAHALTTAQMPAHNHGGGATHSSASIFSYGTKAAPPTPNRIDANSDGGTLQGNTETVGGGEGHGHAGSTAASAGTHTHALNNVAASSLPPYYALCYIMRVVL